MDKRECGSCPEHHLVLDHHNTLGGLVESVNTLKGLTEELRDVSYENKTITEGLCKDVRNGLTKTIETSIANLNTSVSNLNVEVEKLKKTAWVGELLDKTWKKVIAVVIIVLFLSGLNSATYGLVNKYVNVQQNIRHYHTLIDGKILIHSHETPDGKLVIENEKPT